MPLGGLGTVLFTGWVLQRHVVSEAIGIRNAGLFQAWSEAAALRHAGGHRAGIPQPARADLARPRSSVQNAPVG